MKAIWRSKTFWVNVLAGAAAVANGPLGLVVAPETLAIVVAAINVGLRFVTDTPVSLTGH